MSREYTISAAGQTILGATTLISIRPATTCALEILRAWVGQTANATSAQQRVQLLRQAAALPTVVSETPEKMKEGDPVSQIVGGTALAAGTCGINASAEGAGTKTPILEDAFNVLNGWLWVATPAETIILSPGSANVFSLFLPVAPPSTANWAFGLTYRELG